MEKVDAESAQAIIVGGFLIAIGMIAVATIINGMIFSQNIDARGVQVDDESISDITESTVHETRYVMDRSMWRNNTPAEASSYYNGSMANYTKSLQALPFAGSASISNETVARVSAWQFVQNNSGNYDADDDSDNWVVADEVDKFLKMDFIMDEPADSDPPLTIQVNDTSSPETRVWNLTYGTDGNAIPAPVPVPPGGEDYISVCATSCKVYNSSTISSFDDGDPVKLEMLEGDGEINDTSKNLKAKDANLHVSTGDEYKIYIKNGEEVDGTYEIRVKGSSSAPNGSTGLCGGPPCSSPERRVTGIVHRTTYHLNYTDVQSTHSALVNETLPPQVVP